MLNHCTVSDFASIIPLIALVVTLDIEATFELTQLPTLSSPWYFNTGTLKTNLNTIRSLI